MRQSGKRFYLLLLIFAVINLIQAIVTPVSSDEAYYMTFAQNPAWGYFDHPPMVAWILYAGSLFMNGITGLRIMTVLLSTLTLMLIWKLIPEPVRQDKNSAYTFFLLVLAFPVFNMYGFISTPDVPLLFFGTLYILLFRKLLQKADIVTSLMLGIVAAALIYSKYHGGIIILLSVILNLNVLRKPHIYISGLIAAALLLPHLLWQMDHDFITFNYHLFERTKGTFQLKHVLEYLGGTIGILNPLIILFLIILIIRDSGFFKYAELFWKKLFIAFITFFFLYSFRSKTEAHWVAFAAVPLLIILMTILSGKNKYSRQLKLITLISAGLILLARVIIILPLPLKTDFHKEKRDYYSAIEKLAKERNVVFVNSYQRAAKFTFYTGKKAMSLNNVYYRKNQYDLWNCEDDFDNRNILLIGNWPSAFFDSLITRKNELILYKKIDKFPLISKINCTLVSDSPILSQQKNELKLDLLNPYKKTVSFNRTDFPVVFSAVLENKEKTVILPLKLKSLPDQVLPDQLLHLTANIDLRSLSPGTYSCCFVCKTGYLYDQQISRKYEMEIQ
ncbi:ArnT family glycosyltransferase [Saccharicrinis sp. FJH54]|uniref:ArnT family glycosyltransferase n=1 Tax=Saccharicrinis sp. FJH54 TaxID=3344665 RepID=UPI0035D5066B